MIYIIDHKDSFTHNVIHQFAKFDHVECDNFDKINIKKIGKAKVIRGGREITIVTWGAMIHVALDAADKVAKNGLEVEIIDLRTLLPFDAETCIKSVNRTTRLIILQESQWMGGLAHTISSRIIEEAFWNLENPPVVIGALDTPVPFSPPLEDYTIPTSDLVVRHIKQLCNE